MKFLGVNVINETAFNNCANLKKIFIRKDVKIIHPDAIINCFNLEKIIIGKKLETLNNNITSLLEKLNYIKVTPNNLYFSDEDGILYNKAKDRLIKYPYNKKDPIFSSSRKC